MASVADTVFPAPAAEEFARIAAECRSCYQCGTCTSKCPSAAELDSGPRRLVRLIIAGDMAAVLGSDDLWRCTECGGCTTVCRMDIDVAGLLQRLRRLERATRTNGQAGANGANGRCPERAAADVATAQLRRRPRIENARFGVAMASRGHVPKDKVGAAGMGVKMARQRIRGARVRPSGPAAAGAGQLAAGRAADTVTLPFYAGCALPQDHELHALVHDVAAGFGVRLDEAPDTGCCGHPSRGAVPSQFAADERVCTACPACDASLASSGVASVPLWDALAEQARRRGLGLRAASDRFVPYVGCLADRDAALASLTGAAELASASAEIDYPSLHAGCCGALGGMYRGATAASAALLRYAAERRAPVVSPCSLCRDNLRSAARELKLSVPVHFWPEFFRAATPATPAPAPEETTHA